MYWSVHSALRIPSMKVHLTERELLACSPLAQVLCYICKRRVHQVLEVNLFAAPHSLLISRLQGGATTELTKTSKQNTAKAQHRQSPTLDTNRPSCRREGRYDLTDKDIWAMITQGGRAGDARRLMQSGGYMERSPLAMQLDPDHHYFEPQPVRRRLSFLVSSFILFGVAPVDGLSTRLCL